MLILSKEFQARMSRFLLTMESIKYGILRIYD